MAEVVTAAVSAAGFKFEIAADVVGAPGAYQELAEIREDDMDLPEDSRVVIKYRTNRSPRKYMEAVYGPLELGDATVSMNFLPGNAGHVLIEAAFTNGTKVWCRVTNGVATYVVVWRALVSKRPKMFKGAETDRVTYTFASDGPNQIGSTFL